MKEPLVYIILVNYNGYKDTVECIKSIKDIHYFNYKIILVENNSKDEEIIKNDEYINSNAIVLYSDVNGGFSAGNNIGIKYALEQGADYVLLLNNDTTVDKEFLKKLVDVSENNENIGITTGNIFFYSEKNKLWYSNGDYSRKSGMTEMCCYTSDCAKKVTFACGCLMLLKRKMIEEIGMLDDMFFLYSEDTDYCCRALDAKWDIFWTSESRIYHKISASTVENSDFQQYYLTRNNLYMIKKYGNSHAYAYVRRLWCCLKDVLRHRCNIKPIIYAYIDFMKKREGKTDRY